MEKFVHTSNKSNSRWTFFISSTKNWFVYFIFIEHLNYVLFLVRFLEVEYDAKRDEKEKHEAKMKEVHQLEQLRKEQETSSKN